MTLTTHFSELFGIDVPVALAPMAGSAGGALAAAVSSGGGLGLVGGGRGERSWLEREVAIVASATDKPWGVGFLSWSASVEVVEWAIEAGARAVMLSFGDPRQLARPVQESQARLVIQVTDLEEARQALDVGAEVIVAQGAEAGGHGGGRGTFPFVPAVVDIAGGVPVLAAGGVADGRGLAAALALGAGGALIGTRFQASPEALIDDGMARALVDGRGEDTERTRVIDIARGSPWPARYPGRLLRNAFLDRWRGREAELEGDEAAKADYRAAAARGDLSVAPVWAGEGIDLISSLTPAAELVARLAAEAESAILAAGRAISA